MSKNPCSEIILGTMAYDPKGMPLGKIHMISPPRMVSYTDVKVAVEAGVGIMQILKMRPIQVNKLIMIDLYKKAKQEIWEEKELVKTKAGRLLYV